ncbi:universal stress protein [Arthrobacter sp. NPDC080031]|uniref:universal stress protein n=1 Tax=Arthrobacter sp. NPDC080031 TaxID=3155918 RepID=UPI00344C4AC1
MSGTILVGVDGSKTARRAAESARDIAAALNASLHVVTAFDADRTRVVGIGSDEWIVSNAESAERVARTVAESLGHQIIVTYSAARGRPADALIGEALKRNASMIVVGNRRMKGIGRVLGSVANSVAHNAPCDVYIANTDDAD